MGIIGGDVLHLVLDVPVDSPTLAFSRWVPPPVLKAIYITESSLFFSAS
jgi:hypothetical protein